MMRRKLRIVYISKYARTFLSGFPTRQAFLSKSLSSLGNSVLLISSNSNGVVNPLNSATEIDGIKSIEEYGVINWVLDGPQITLGLNLKRVWSMIVFEINLFKIIDRLEQFKPHVIIVSSLSLLTIINGILLKKLLNSKLIFEVRDIWPATLVDVGGFSSRNLLIRFFSFVEKIGYKNADLIVGTMPNLGEHVKNLVKVEAEVVCLPMGFDPYMYSESDEILPTPIEEFIPQGKFLVGYAGSIGKINNIDLIINAAQIISKHNETIHFVIMGNGPILSFYQKEYSQLKNLTWIPAQPKSHVNGFLKRCQLLVHPIPSKSIYRYGVSPNKWIDYMYSGRPIICPYDGYPSVINEADCGLFIEPENPEVLAQTIMDFASKPATELDEMGGRGRRYLEKHLSYENLAANYIDLINRIST